MLPCIKEILFSVRGSGFGWPRKVSLLTRTPASIQLTQGSRVAAAERAPEALSKRLPPSQKRAPAAGCRRERRSEFTPGFWGLALEEEKSKRAWHQHAQHPRGPGMGGHNFSSAVPLFIFTCTCSCKMKKVIRELHCNEEGISHRFRHNHFFWVFFYTFPSLHPSIVCCLPTHQYRAQVPPTQPLAFQ